MLSCDNSNASEEKLVLERQEVNRRRVLMLQMDVGAARVSIAQDFKHAINVKTQKKVFPFDR